MELWELVARESIRDLVARYNANGDSGRFDQVMECFAPNAVMNIEGVLHSGQGEIRAMFEGAADSTRDRPEPVLMRHYTSTLQIDVTSPTEATSRCYYQVITAKGADHWGRYVDAFTVVDGKWRFSHRKVSVDGRMAGGFAAGR